VIAGNHKDIAVGVSERIKRRLQRQCVEESGVYISVVGVEVPPILFVRHIGFDALAQRVAAILEERVSYDRA
jgi:hypothetical protein